MNEITFKLSDDFIELVKLLKVSGLCESGGSAKYAIGQSLVKVDGRIELRKGCKLRKGQRIEYGGSTIQVV
ncbi:MAG TPA: RNA-binding S4 domain-containing protein [Candidatus Omnitrophota bacterium]|nr:RNA-binding S4 domain-containing protein [Candidatus Omnitrophota bacterium]